MRWYIKRRNMARPSVHLLTEHCLFHGRVPSTGTEVSLLPDRACGTLHLLRDDRITSYGQFRRHLKAHLFRAYRNHGAMWCSIFLRHKILLFTYLLTYLLAYLLTCLLTYKGAELRKRLNWTKSETKWHIFNSIYKHSITCNMQCDLQNACAQLELDKIGKRAANRLICLIKQSVVTCRTWTCNNMLWRTHVCWGWVGIIRVRLIKRYVDDSVVFCQNYSQHHKTIINV